VIGLDIGGGGSKVEDLFINYNGSRWTMAELIAKGGFSEVYKARSRKEEKELACKVAT